MKDVPTIYGISNCDAIKKTIKWFEVHQIPFCFHDYRKQGITDTFIRDCCKKASWQKVLNSRSTQLKKITHNQPVTNEEQAIALMQQEPATIKRPLIIFHQAILLGYDEQAFINLSNQLKKNNT